MNTSLDLPAVEQAVDVLHTRLADTVVVGEKEGDTLALTATNPEDNAGVEAAQATVHS